MWIWIKQLKAQYFILYIHLFPLHYSMFCINLTKTDGFWITSKRQLIKTPSENSSGTSDWCKGQCHENN